MPERAYLQFNNYKEARYPTLAQMNVLYLKGELAPEQLAFMAPEKPEFELYDLENDPFELNNLADDEGNQQIKSELLAELEKWREKIDDQGVSEEFRNGGWPADYPTRTLEEWEERLAKFEKWVFRSPTEKMKHPF